MPKPKYKVGQKVKCIKWIVKEWANLVVEVTAVHKGSENFTYSLKALEKNTYGTGHYDEHYLEPYPKFKIRF